MNEPRVVRREDLAEAGQTPGMIRRTAFDEPGVWVGTARTDPGGISGWHHHAEHTTYVYCVAGAIRIDFGPGGSRSVRADAGNFLLIPANTVHREANPTDEEQIVVLTRVGSGPVLVNVEGPPLE